MELSEVDAQLWQTLVSDPEARQKLLREAKRINPKLPIPEVDAEERISARVSTEVESYKKEVEELKSQLQKKMSGDIVNDRRNSVKKAPYFLTDEQVAELEGRMIKDGNQYGSYEEALKYYQFQDSPTHPTGRPISSPFTNKAAGQEDWRKMIHDPKSPLFDKRKRKEMNQKIWRETSEELSRQAGRR